MAVKTNEHYSLKSLGDNINLYYVSKNELMHHPGGMLPCQGSHRVTLKRPFHPLWSFLFPKMMTGQIKGDALKKNS